jgi:hypothetical protein
MCRAYGLSKEAQAVSILIVAIVCAILARDLIDIRALFPHSPS